MLTLAATIAPLILAQLSLVRFVQCQNVEDNVNNPAILPYLTQVVYGRLSNLTSVILSSEVSNRSSFCIQNPEADWNRAFNYSNNLDFLTACIKRTQGDITQRLCTAAEVGHVVLAQTRGLTSKTLGSYLLEISTVSLAVRVFSVLMESHYSPLFMKLKSAFYVNGNVTVIHLLFFAAELTACC
ncbi:unnamed protein product [Ilex paraguariensis]|uniref:Uncharacterized protein n=1 Tax=Ilex paraguariensis TaxID=185542 RepID=A0ABC8S0W8_9AQUA